ncbi:MAG: hypothetical protein DMF67_11455 [Acidobacteria bacterium]|nr:MAG: hypothetical protein DMF67_11455 [Acidobacteriota bacterium]
MDDRMKERTGRLREFFGLGGEAELLAPDAPQPEPGEGLGGFQIEWHVIPRAEVVPFDDAYAARLYPRAPRDFTRMREHKPTYRDVLAGGHARLQGRMVGVEATQKPRYLPGNRQFYGSVYGHDPSADPFAVYLGRAAMVNGTRYDHNYLSLREFVRVVNEDWRARRLLPAGYRATVCPPAVFNLVGAVFHPEWSETETLELGFYRDEAGNATCYAVGSNAPGDFSFIAEVEGEAEWSLAGFRVALVPE